MMANPNQRSIIDAITAATPPVMTAKALAQKLDWKATKASQIMGCMFFAGQLDRIVNRNAGNQYTYSIRPDAPPLLRKSITPLPRIAERLTEQQVRIARLARMAEAAMALELETA